MDEPAVRVTLADIYAKVVETGVKVAELSGKMDAIAQKALDHENRLRDLEKSTITRRGAYALAGLVGIIVTTVGFFVDVGNKLWR